MGKQDSLGKKGGHAVADTNGQVHIGVEFVAAVDTANHRVRREAADDDQENCAEYRSDVKFSANGHELAPFNFRD